MKKKAHVTGTRLAGDDHAVITVEGGDFIARPKPCDGCPWLKSNDGLFPAEAFIHSAPTAYDMATTTFACHESGQAKPQVCAGFLLRGADHSLSVRLHISKGDYKLDDVQDDGRPLHDSYRDMAVANGVHHDDPALAKCR